MLRRMVRRLCLLFTLAACGDAAGDPSGDDTTGTTGTAGTTGASTIDTPTTDTPTTDAPTTGEALDIREQLEQIDGLDVEERESPVPGHRYFVLGLEQPADHDDPAGGTFVQRMTLLHRDSAAPLVFVTAGYFIYVDDPALGEPATLLAANQLTVEHRFFEPSRPDPADWSTLTIAQSAADHHRIAERFKGAEIYPGPWVATGASKGGMTAVYFRRFHPDDVDATIAYVAPHSQGDADPRYLDFVATRGDAACRDALLKFQREVLLRRAAMVGYMQSEAAVIEDITYTYLDEDQALESAALEFVFTFWQYDDADLCPQIPGQDASDEDVWLFLDVVTPPRLWSDAYFLGYEPYFWQAATQLGYPAYDETNLADLLLHPGLDVAASYVLPGRGDPVLDPAAMIDVGEWLATAGERTMFIYGENDPYTAAAFEPGPVDSLRLTVPGGNHGANILDLAAADREAALAALEAWTGVTPVVPTNRTPVPARVRLRGHAW